MALFDRQRQFLNDYKATLLPTLQRTLNTSGDNLKELITERQLFQQGIDGTGQKLRPYARTTIRIKKRKGQPTDRTTLRDTGDFHKTLVVAGTPEAILVEGNVPYTKFLIGNFFYSYGEEAIKPTSENLDGWLQRFYNPAIIKERDTLFTK